MGRQIVKALNDQQVSITDLMTDIKAKVNDFTSSHWQGNSAVLFATEFQEWWSLANTQISELKNLASRMATEISNWEAAAAKLGD